MRVLVVGAGALGLQATRQLVQRRHDVTATARSETRLAAIREAGATSVAMDVADARDASGLFDAVLYSVAPGAGGDAALAFRDGALRVQARLAPTRFVYVSSTGVYAQHGGEWVDEDSPADADGNPALIRSAEQELRARGGIVVRCGGLYGPGRWPGDWLRDPTRRARLSTGAGAAFMNWVRLEDAAACLVAAIEGATEGRIYLAVDDEPVRRADFWALWCERAGVPPLTFTGEASDLGKRCRNARAKRELGWTLTFPTYREGASLPASAVVE